MAHWDAIVIGSGLGGLAAGAAFARAGKRVLVLERLANFGGAATVYRHGALSIEASLHEIAGHELHSAHGALRRLGLADDITAIQTAEFYQVRSALFPPLTCPHGIGPARAALTAALPASSDGLERYFRALDRIYHALEQLEDVGARGLGGMAGLFLSGRMWAVLANLQLTMADAFARMFKTDEAGKFAIAPHLAYFDDDPAKMSFLGFAAISASYLEGGSYYVQGGSRSITMALLHAIAEQGGQARHKRDVTHILLDAQGRAAGVRHAGANGAEEEDTADAIFGNAAPGVLEHMLPPPQRAQMQARYASYEPSISLFTIALGLDRPAADFGVSAYSTFIYPDWMTRFDQYPVCADVFGGEPGAALPLYGLADYDRLNAGLGQGGDHRLITLTGVDRLWAWEQFSEAEEKSRRERWIDAFIADLDRRFPGIAKAVRHREMANARTMKTRLGAPHGEVYGFRPTPQRLFARPPSPRTPVDGLWLASAFTISGGYAGAMQGGLMAADAALGDLRRRARARRAEDILYSA
jgi:phytoene dehydrogenase-like protein